MTFVLVFKVNVSVARKKSSQHLDLTKFWMFTENELQSFFKNIPNDLDIEIGDKIYSTNFQIFSIFSNYIKKNYEMNPKQTKVDIKDPGDVFSDVLKFLQYEKIDITPLNVYDFDSIASYFEIDALKKKIKLIMESKTSVENVIPRLLHDPNNRELLLFFVENIGEITNKQNIFLLPSNILLQAAQSDSFMDPIDHYLFIFDCCLQYPELITSFLSDDEVRNIPEEAIEILLTNPKYSELDSKIPTFVIAIKLQRIIIQIENDITNIIRETEKAKLKYDQAKAGVENLNNSQSDLNKELDALKMQEKEAYEQFIAIGSEILSTFAPNISEFSISNNTLHSVDQYITNINNLINETRNKLNDLKFAFLFVETNKISWKVVKEWDERINSVKNLRSKLIPNSDDIDKLIKEMQDLSHQLIGTSTMHKEEE